MYKGTFAYITHKQKHWYINFTKYKFIDNSYIVKFYKPVPIISLHTRVN